jgi:hypothetical protein
VLLTLVGMGAIGAEERAVMERRSSRHPVVDFFPFSQPYRKILADMQAPVQMHLANNKVHMGPDTPGGRMRPPVVLIHYVQFNLFMGEWAFYLILSCTLHRLRTRIHGTGTATTY